MSLLRPLDRRLHFMQKQDQGEYFGKDCGARSLARGQGGNSGVIYTDQDVYPYMIPYKERQVVSKESPTQPPRKGDRVMHRTTIDFNKSKPEFISTTKHEYGGLRGVQRSALPHGCRSMHTSQIVFGRTPGFQRSSTYSGTFTDKHTEPHYKVLEPVINNKVVSIGSNSIAECLKPQRHTNMLTEYGSTHRKLGAMLDMSQPKYPIPMPRPLPRHYDVLTGKDIGASWQPVNQQTSGNRVLSAAISRETAGFLF